MSAPNIITTGHNSDGLSTFIDNPKYKAFSPHVGILYGTVGDGPINLNDNADISAFEAHDNPGLIPKEGSVVLVAEWPPGTDSIAKIHRTLSVDVGVMIEGEIICQLDSGETRLLKKGDVLLQRGTKHAWKNPSTSEPARMLCFVMPSHSVKGAKETA
ncbi:hypothetical protein G7Y79_00072g097590 [Physcia stellaris]|nr:hypothetical protein G7Y79_00072g097590 [Physcia stellaris]